MRWQYLLSSVASGVIVVAAASPAQAQKPKPAPAVTHEMKPAPKPEAKPENKEQAVAKKTAEHAEHKAFGSAEAEPEHLLKGVKLTKDERTQVNAIEKK